jgi:hypothetical protein
MAWQASARANLIDRHGLRFQSAPNNGRPRNLLSASLSILARWVPTVWSAWLGAFELVTALTASHVGNTHPIFPISLSVLMLAGSVSMVIAAPVRVIRRDLRERALAGLLVGRAPLWFLVGHILMAMRPPFDRHVPPG